MAPTQSSSPRICMPTWRNFAKKTFRCSLYEAEDVLAEMDDVDLIHLDMSWGAWFKDTTWLTRPLFHDVTRKLIYANPGLKKVRLSAEYEAFIAVCNLYYDLPYINAIEDWSDHCKIKICWIDEIWAEDIPNFKYWLDALSRFDYLFTGNKGSVSVLSQAAHRPCYWLPWAIDAFRFSPFPKPLARVIDVYSVGRRHEAIHHELLKEAERGGLFYVYDTLSNVANTYVLDHQQHRSLFASMAKRSRYFMVAPAMMDSPHKTQGQIEIGYRYFEGAAAGAVMIGQVPNCDAFRDLFTWPDAVIEVQPNGSDVLAVIRACDSDPERMAALRSRNAKEALLHHDWLYRWKEMFRVAGIEPTPRMAARERRLKDLAGLAADPTMAISPQKI